MILQWQPYHDVTTPTMILQWQPYHDVTVLGNPTMMLQWQPYHDILCEFLLDGPQPSNVGPLDLRDRHESIPEQGRLNTLHRSLYTCTEAVYALSPEMTLRNP